MSNISGSSSSSGSLLNKPILQAMKEAEERQKKRKKPQALKITPERDDKFNDSERFAKSEAARKEDEARQTAGKEITARNKWGDSNNS